MKEHHVREIKYLANVSIYWPYLSAVRNKTFGLPMLSHKEEKRICYVNHLYVFLLKYS